MKTIWKKKKQIEKEDIAKVSEQFNLSPVTSEILLERDLNTPNKIKTFLTKGVKNLDELSLYYPIQKAVNRILDALENEEKITIYGDYDCDGTIGSAIIYDYLKNIDANVNYYIPNRQDEGYGLNEAAIKELHNNGTDLIITVDNGISAVKEVDLIRELGMDIVITDHHTPLEELPKAENIIDFKLEKDSYFKEVCGAGVSFLLILALDEVICSPEFNKREISELVSIATIADVVQLKGFNRDLVKLMLNEMNTKGIKSKPLKSLIDKSEVEKLSVGNVAFRIAPMINAAGRIGNAEKVVEFLTTDDEDIITNNVEYLYDINKDRSRIEKEILEEAEQMIIDEELDNDEVIVLSKQHWHAGVIGIVASKIQEKYNKPVVIISFDDDYVGHASCRSVPGFDILKALDDSKEFLEKYGGHSQAAGLTIKLKSLMDFKKHINKYGRENGLSKTPDQLIYYDLELEANQLNANLLSELEQLEPFGVSNPEPVFKIKNIQTSNPKLVGNNKHLTFNTNNISSIYFNQTDKQLPEKEGFSILAKLRRNDYNNNIQLILVDHKLNPFINFEQADDIVKNSKTADEFLAQIQEFGQRNLINRKYLVKLYQLAKKVGNRGFYINDFINKSQSTIIDLALALNILEEARLLQYKYDNGILKFKILPSKGKVDLKDTRTYQLLKE